MTDLNDRDESRRARLRELGGELMVSILLGPLWRFPGGDIRTEREAFGWLAQHDRAQEEEKSDNGPT